MLPLSCHTNCKLKKKEPPKKIPLISHALAFFIKTLPLKQHCYVTDCRNECSTLQIFFLSLGAILRSLNDKFDIKNCLLFIFTLPNHIFFTAIIKTTSLPHNRYEK